MIFLQHLNKKSGKCERKNQDRVPVSSLSGNNKPMHGAQGLEPPAMEISAALLDNVLDKVKQEVKSVEKKQQEQTERGYVLQAQMEEFFKANREMQEKLKEQTEKNRMEQVEKEQREHMEQLIKEREHVQKLERKQTRIEEEIVRKQMEDN
ncbi:unnamed protein product, partial [Lymnaea stagnalis]